MQVLYPGHRGRGRAQVEDDALDPFVAPDGVEPLVQLLDAEARPAREALPERARRVGQGREALLEDEDDVRRRSTERPQEARDEPPQVPERKQQHPLGEVYGPTLALPGKRGGERLDPPPPPLRPPPPWGGGCIEWRFDCSW